MARFEVIEEENTRYVLAILQDEEVRAEAGALAYFHGDIKMRARIPSPLQMLRASISEEAAIRPVFSGTGRVVLESSPGGFHVFEINEKPWILERGSYWASESGVSIGISREKVLNSFWSGTGLIEYYTLAAGRGKVVLNSPGPVEEIDLGEEEFACDGHKVIARSSRVQYWLRRPSNSIVSSWLTGEKMLRVYRGPGRILVSPAVYWNEALLKAVRKS